MVNRLRSNHYNLNESLHRKSYIGSARCECGVKIQDINHLVLRCSLHDEAREELYRQLEKRESGISIRCGEVDKGSGA